MKNIIKKLTIFRRRQSAWLILTICLLAPTAGFGQRTTALPTTENGTNAGLEKLTVAASGEISLRGANIELNELAENLSRRLKIPIILSPLLRGKSIAADFRRLPLEQALRQIAPHVRVDYVTSQKNDSELRPIAVYLNGYNEKEPLTEKSIENDTFAVVIEGDTEETANASKGGQLKISVERERLTVVARRQSLAFVLSEIASRAGLEFDLRYDGGEQLIDLEIDDQPLTETLVRLSPDVRVFLRKDLLTEQTTAFKVSLNKKD